MAKQIKSLNEHDPSLLYAGIPLPARSRAMRTAYGHDMPDILWDLLEKGQATSDAAIAYALGITKESLLEWVSTRPQLRAAYTAAMQAAEVRITRLMEQGVISPAAGKYLLGTLGVLTELEKRQLSLSERALNIRTGMTDAAGTPITIEFSEAPAPARVIDEATGLVVEAG